MSKTVQEIVLAYLEANGYDGLYDSDNECACLKADLMPCANFGWDCKAGYRMECDCDEGHRYHIGPAKATEGAG